MGLIQSLLNSMGWPKNELYEAFKGNWIPKRIIPLVIQSGMAGFLLMPSIIITIIASFLQNGSVLKLVLKKNKPNKTPLA